ncbi:FAD-dependent oxidoreductase domain-containing protein 2-like [Glandiceps talaboti]
MASNAEGCGPGTYNYVIVGAGPAGLQMGYFLNKTKRKYVILEANDVPGSFFKTHPRHRTLISINKRFNPFPEAEFNMRHDWNSLLSDDPEMRFTKYSEELFPSADDFIRYIDDFARKFDIKIKYNTRVKAITKVTDDEYANFALTTTDGAEYRSKVLLMATGARSELIPESIKGWENMETYATHDVDAKKYDGKTVCIIGNGNSAFETANHLAGHASLLHIFGDRKLKHAWNTHFVGDLRAVNNTVLDMYQLKSLHTYLTMKLTSVDKLPDGKLLCVFDDVITHWRDAQGHFFLKPPPYDHVICCTGFKYVDTTLFADDIKPDTKTDGKFPVLSTTWESNVPNMYYMGTSMQCTDRKAASGFIHGFRYNVRSLYHLLEERYNDIPYPRENIPLNLDCLAEKVVGRTSIGDSIYQMNNVLCHVLAIRDFKSGKQDEVSAIYFEDLPKPYVLENLSDRFKDYKHVFVIVLAYGFEEFGDSAKDALDFVHTPDFEDEHCLAFLHPVITYFKDGKNVGVIRLAESLVLRYDVPNFLDQNPDMNKNRMKNFFNKHLNLEPGKTFNASFLGSIDILKEKVIPFTEEEKARLPDLSQYKHCLPYSIDLLTMER